MAYTPNINGGRMNIGITGNTNGNSLILSTGTFYLAGGSNVTLSQNANTISISAPRPGGTTTLSRWEAPEDVFISIGTPGQGSLSIQHMYMPFNITGQSAKIALSFTGNTGFLFPPNGSITLSLWMGIYGLTGSTLTVRSSGSISQSTTWDGGNAGNDTNINGMRQLTVPMNVNMTPGEYWMAAVMSTSSGGQNASISIYGNNLVTAGASNAVLMPIGSGTAAARDVILFQGIHSTASYTMPNSIVSSQINNLSASYVQQADFYNAIYNIDL
jgi:hypothetical protein